MSDRPNAPLRDETLVDKDGLATLPAQVFFEGLDTCVSSNSDAISVLEPQYKTITASESPYTAATNDYILADVTLGNVDITPPTPGRIHVSKTGGGSGVPAEFYKRPDGVSFYRRPDGVSRYIRFGTGGGAGGTLTIIATVNGVVNPVIVANGDAPSIAFIGTEHRYV